MTQIRVVNSQSVVRVTQSDGTQIRVDSTAQLIQGPPGPRLVDIVYNVAGSVPSNRTILGYVASAPITIIPANAVAIAATGNTGDTSISILDLLGNPLGTVTFLSGQTTGTVTISAVTLIKSQGIKFFHPTSINTLTDLVVTIPANRGS